MPAYPGCPGKRTLNRRNVVVVVVVVNSHIGPDILLDLTYF